MPHDVTAYFKAKAKTIVQRRAKGHSQDAIQSPIAAEGPSMAYLSIAKSARRTALDIHDLAHMILAKRREYLDFNAPIVAMTNAERDTFDRDSEKGLRGVAEIVRQLEERVRKEKLQSEQEKQHLTAVCGLLEKDVKKTGRVVAEMRKLRVTAMANRKELSRLSTLVEAAKSKKKTSERASSPPELRRRKPSPTQDSSSAPKKDVIALEEEASVDPEVIALPPAKMEQLQVENQKLFEKFTNVHSTVASLETQMFEIQRLQETFADKVFDQEKEIEFINETAIGTTENLRDGNEWIRQAISNSAGRRVIVLFCIVVLSFTLLFLDWYNP